MYPRGDYMGFPVERYSEKLHDRQIPGTQLNAAVDCWFTSEGKTIPRFCKIEGTEGELITIRNIRILKEEQKIYAGIPSKKHWCEAEHNRVMMRFFLVFYSEDCVWKIVI